VGTNRPERPFSTGTALTAVQLEWAVSVGKVVLVYTDEGEMGGGESE
jgi:hypothetical protein